jgi:hypothetical protein
MGIRRFEEHESCVRGGDDVQYVMFTCIFVLEWILDEFDSLRLNPMRARTIIELDQYL